ncbi:MAG: YabP/YqfC family sporulation protein [Firmicutes bacterium]|nr:YabP/YqfC family sporulation protein [Bacillota bacterium]
MKLLDEVIYDFDFTMPRVIATGRLVIFENMSEIVMISESAITVSSGVRSKRFTTVTGENFVIKEIGEGRLVIEGTIRSVEFL